MPDTYLPVKDLVWEDTGYIQTVNHGARELHEYRYHLDLYKPLSEWDVYDYWEKERLESMQENITQGDVLYEIGAEVGWMAAVYSKYMTDELVLIEPTAQFWPNMKAIFEKNGLAEPLFCWPGFAGETPLEDLSVLDSRGWPVEAFEEDIIEKLKYRNLHDNSDVKEIASVRVDDIVAQTGIVPNAMSIDVEGAEMLVLRGAEKTLRKHKPKLWVSVHPDMLLRDYDTKHEDLLAFLHDCGYTTRLLALDHEHHVLCLPKEKP